MHTRSLPAKAGNDGYAETLATIKEEKNKTASKKKCFTPKFITRSKDRIFQNLRKLDIQFSFP